MGEYRAIANSNKGRRPKIKDEDKFRNFVRENSNKTQKQMAELWYGSLTQQNVSYFCKKLGITRKSGQTPRRRKRSEPAEFLIRKGTPTEQGNADQDKNLRLSRKK